MWMETKPMDEDKPEKVKSRPGTSKEFDKGPKIHPGRLIKTTPLEVFQASEFSQAALTQLKEATKKRYKGTSGDKKREKRAWELRTTDGTNFFQLPSKHLTPEEEEELAYEQERLLEQQARDQERKRELALRNPRGWEAGSDQEEDEEEGEEDAAADDDDDEEAEKKPASGDQRDVDELTPPTTPAKGDPGSPDSKTPEKDEKKEKKPAK